jgi:2-phospho-L-lactate guanylyltransferase
MGTVAILPVKSFGEAKRRLEPELDPGSRRTLAEAMFCDVLVALRRAGSLKGILVVTADATARRIAAGHGAGVLDDLDRGHNEAARRGIQQVLQDSRADRALLVPGDCPLLDPCELDQLIALQPVTPSALIVPDRHGTGTNALLLSPPDCLAPAFGPDSCRRHAVAAATTGTTPQLVAVSSLELDIDTPADLAALRTALADTHGRAAHTRGMLRQLSRSGQP